MKRYLLGAGLLAVVGAIAVPALASHSWNNYHWARTTSSFTLPVIDSTTTVWDYAFSQSLSRWGQSNVLDFDVVAVEEDSRTRRRCPMSAGQMRVCNAAYGQNGWLGLATIGLDSNGHIDQGTAKTNDSYGWYFDAYAGEDNHVMCQEIGHVFGLGHTSEDGSSQKTCMDYSSDPQSQWPNAHDYDMIASIYSHLDSYDSHGGGGGGGGGNGCNAPPGKGCNKAGVGLGVGGQPPMGVRVHKNDRHEIWAASRPDGGLWIHHVYLVPGESFEPHAH
jgi:hypothetical protein